MNVEAPKRLVVTTAAACRAELHEWCDTEWCDCGCHVVVGVIVSCPVCGAELGVEEDGWTLEHRPDSSHIATPPEAIET